MQGPSGRSTPRSRVRSCSSRRSPSATAARVPRRSPTPAPELRRAEPSADATPATRRPGSRRDEPQADARPPSRPGRRAATADPRPTAMPSGRCRAEARGRRRRSQASQATRARSAERGQLAQVARRREARRRRCARAYGRAEPEARRHADTSAEARRPRPTPSKPAATTRRSAPRPQPRAPRCADGGHRRRVHESGRAQRRRPRRGPEGDRADAGTVTKPRRPPARPAPTTALPESTPRAADDAGRPRPTRRRPDPPRLTLRRDRPYHSPAPKGPSAVCPCPSRRRSSIGRAAVL